MEPDAATAPEPEPGGADSPCVYLNGKFLAQRTTGVQRVARALLTAMDADARLPAGRVVLLCPAGAVAPDLHRIALRRTGPSWLPLHLWEQTVLPLHARSGLLLNLAGTAPWFSGRCATMIHDAAVWDVPETYTAVFRLWYRALFRRQAKRAERLFTVSAYSRTRLSQCLQLASGRCQVLRNGSDHLDAIVSAPAVLQRLGLRDRPYLLTVGSRSAAKNLEMLVQAYRLSGLGPGVPLVCVGGSSAGVFAAGQGSAAARCDGWIDAGVVSDAELKALYGGASALLVPSRHEGFCLPAAEALRAGCPVLATAVTALPELFGEVVASMPVDDPEAWAGAMRRLVADGQRRLELLAAGRRHFGDALWADSARQLLEALAPERA